MKRKLLWGLPTLLKRQQKRLLLFLDFLQGTRAGGSKFRTAFAILSSEKELAREKGEHIEEDRARRRVRHPDHAEYFKNLEVIFQERAKTSPFFGMCRIII